MNANLYPTVSFWKSGTSALDLQLTLSTFQANIVTSLLAFYASAIASSFFSLFVGILFIFCSNKKWARPDKIITDQAHVLATNSESTFSFITRIVGLFIAYRRAGSALHYLYLGVAIVVLGMNYGMVTGIARLITSGYVPMAGSQCGIAAFDATDLAAFTAKSTYDATSSQLLLDAYSNCQQESSSSGWCNTTCPGPTGQNFIYTTYLSNSSTGKDCELVNLDLCRSRSRAMYQKASISLRDMGVSRSEGVRLGINSNCQEIDTANHEFIGVNTLTTNFDLGPNVLSLDQQGYTIGFHPAERLSRSYLVSTFRNNYTWRAIDSLLQPFHDVFNTSWDASLIAIRVGGVRTSAGGSNEDTIFGVDPNTPDCETVGEGTVTETLCLPQLNISFVACWASYTIETAKDVADGTGPHVRGSYETLAERFTTGEGLSDLSTNELKEAYILFQSVQPERPALLKSIDMLQGSALIAQQTVLDGVQFRNDLNGRDEIIRWFGLNALRHLHWARSIASVTSAVGQVIVPFTDNYAKDTICSRTLFPTSAYLSLNVWGTVIFLVLGLFVIGVEHGYKRIVFWFGSHKVKVAMIELSQHELLQLHRAAIENHERGKALDERFRPPQTTTVGLSDPAKDENITEASGLVTKGNDVQNPRRRPTFIKGLYSGPPVSANDSQTPPYGIERYEGEKKYTLGIFDAPKLSLDEVKLIRIKKSDLE